MFSKIIYSSRSSSSIHVVQTVAYAFSLAGVALALDLAAAPLTPNISRIACQVWATALGATAIAAAVAAWLYGRRVVRSLALSRDGSTVTVRSSGLLGPSLDRWPIETLRFSDPKAGDRDGAASFGLPRITLKATSGRRHRTYLLALMGKAPVNAVGSRRG